MKKMISTTALLGFCVFATGCNERTQNGNIMSALTPNMQTLDQTYPDHYAGVEVTTNANDRMFHGDAARFWMVDNPSSLSPLPVVQD